MNHVRFGLLAALSLVVILTGCSNNKKPATAPVINAPQRTYTVEKRYTPGVQPYQPKTQAQLDAIYGSASARTYIPPPVAPEPKTMPRATPDDFRVTGDPSWDVPISREWRHIVVHHSASANGSAASFDRAHRDRGWDGLGYHFVIGNGSLSGDGQVEVGFRWKQQSQGAHAGVVEYNQHGIGICLVGDFSNTRPSEAQMASLRRLVRFLQVKTGVTTSEVIGHGNVKGTECPGRYLEMNAFRASLGGGAIGVPIQIERGAHVTAKSARKPGTASSSAAIP